MLTEVDRLNRVISNYWPIPNLEPRLGIRSADEILDHCIRVVEREAGEAGVELVRRPCGNDIPLVLMDTDQMTQVFLNILINAIEATPKGGKVLIGQETDGEGRVQIAVEDTGGGIPREDLDKLFDPFFRQRKKGTGLVWPSSEYYRGHGGEIEVESEPGKERGLLLRSPHIRPRPKRIPWIWASLQEQLPCLRAGVPSHRLQRTRIRKNIGN
jgi:two-component system sensor histidine kinase HydH